VANTQSILQSVGDELKNNPPSIVQSTRQKFGANRALKQSRAILLSKARKRGAKIPYAPGMAKGA
jgi:hypothetical protein